MRLAWIDTIADYPIYGDLSTSNLYNSSFDVSLPLAAVYLKTFLQVHRPHHEFQYFPRRLFRAEGLGYDPSDFIEQADVILTSCSTSDSDDARRILSASKAKGKRTIVGGIYPRFSPDAVLDWGCADYVMTGEGENALIDVLDHIEHNGLNLPTRAVASHSSRRPGSAVLMDLAQLPQPSYEGFPIARYQRFMRSAYILATRGCPAPCHFCTSARLYGYTYRMRPIESVVRELRDLYDLGFRQMTLADDTIGVNRDWALALFALIAAHNPGYRLKVRIRADELSDDLLKQMADSGVEVVQFGVESISLATRDLMHKHLGQKEIEGAFTAILKHPSLSANPLYMLAYPGENWDNLRNNIDFIVHAGTDRRVITYISFTTPYPGTGFAQHPPDR